LRARASWTTLAVFGALLMLAGWLFLASTVNQKCGATDFSCGFLDNPILGVLAFLFGGACLAAGVFYWVILSRTRNRSGGD
jgi:hypothetical protein